MAQNTTQHYVKHVKSVLITAEKKKNCLIFQTELFLISCLAIAKRFAVSPAYKGVFFFKKRRRLLFHLIFLYELVNILIVLSLLYI